MKYRRDIDGLRAVAVLSVVAYHYFPPVLHGGFVGVDIFFVISGYLISGIIFDEIARNDFSVLHFYRRRINRIFPALGCVIAGTLTIGWLVLFPDEYRSLGYNALASTGFVENFYLWLQSGYFDADSQTKPLLHIWSLGVEEQFYILYPPILIVAHRFRMLSGRFLVALCIVSFAFSMYFVKTAPSMDFYLPFSRFWELATGGIVAWRARAVHDGTQAAVQGRTVPTALLAWIGGLALVVSFFAIDARTPFPGAAALLPVLGAALILAAGPLSLPNRLLSNRAAVFVGKISYPLYLWHWPLLAFLFIVNIEKPEPPVRLVVMAIAFVLAIATWLLVETPIRKRHNTGRAAVVLFAILAAIGAAGWVIGQADGFKGRAVNRINAGSAVRASGIDNPPLPEHHCTVPAAVASQFRNCIQQAGRPAPNVLLGDSKADALYHGLMASSPAGGGWLYLGGADATTFGAPLPLVSNNPAYARVQAQSRAAIDYIAANPDIRVVLYAVALRNIYQLDSNGGAGRLFNSYDSRYLAKLRGSKLLAAAQDANMAAVGRLVAAGKTVAILADNPPLPLLRTCDGRLTAVDWLNRALDLRQGEKDPGCRYAKAQYRRDTQPYYAMLDAIKARFGSKVVIIDLTDFYCQADGGRTCATSLGGNALYGYTDHISSHTAGIVGRLINERLSQSGASGETAGSGQATTSDGIGDESAPARPSSTQPK